MFVHSGKHGETLAGNNVSATMFPSLPRALDIYLFNYGFENLEFGEGHVVPAICKYADSKSSAYLRGT